MPLISKDQLKLYRDLMTFQSIRQFKKYDVRVKRPGARGAPAKERFQTTNRQVSQQRNSLNHRWHQGTPPFPYHSARVTCSQSNSAKYDYLLQSMQYRLKIKPNRF